jgi:hypothetical protein
MEEGKAMSFQGTSSSAKSATSKLSSPIPYFPSIRFPKK